MEIIQVNNPKHSNDRVYDPEGISPCLNTMQGGNRQPFIIENHTIAYSKSHRDNGVIQARGKIDDEANCLSTGDGCGNQSTGNYVFTKEESVKPKVIGTADVNRGEDNWNGPRDGYQIYDKEAVSPALRVTQPGNVRIIEESMSDIKFVAGVNPKKTWNKDDNRNLSRNYSQGERIHHPDGISPCISSNMGGTANGSTLITEEDVRNIEVVAHDGSKYESNGRIYGDQGIAPCIGARDFKDPKKIATLETSNIRIRKLTPVECERLQGYKDQHTAFGRLPDGKVYEMSNSQRYKMCGNGISSPVPAYLFPKIFGTEHIRVMSLFSGCGGTELLLPSNFEVVGHCEFDKHASAVLNYHYPNIPNFHDVTQFVDKEVPEFDLLVGGFPCQSWSIAGLRKGFSDERGQLIYNVFDILRKHRPKYLCLENVKGLLSKDGGDAFEAIMEFLSELGYDLDFEVVNSKHFGLAQNRERVFIFGKLK